MKRRGFIQAALAAPAAAIAAKAGIPMQSGRQTAREYYELRAYRLKPGADQGAIDAYFEKALIPALNRLGITPIGAFVEREPKETSPVYLLAPYPSLETFASVSTKVFSDPELLQAGNAYLQAPKADPAFIRIDSWLMLAFAGLPRMDLPGYCREKKPRVFELRFYESHSELKALNKVEMFNAGEIETMKEVGLGPIFYGQTLVGRDLPHLIYMTSGEDIDLHRKHWDAFRVHPTWKKQSSDPQYAGNTSKTSSMILLPKPYSQI
jgi:hypothetical protein